MKEVLLFLAMFWNVENFFDIYDNPDKDDDVFTPMGENHWNWKKFGKKRDDIAKTIMLAADVYGEFPAVLGLCEVENGYVLKELVENTPLARVGYGIIHRDSPDSRGIDAALLYRKGIFTPLESKWYSLEFPTREILYTKGIIKQSDTLHVLVNHWPSKRGSEKSSLPRRYEAAKKTRFIADSILDANPLANILIMGDFNDSPESLPLEYLVAVSGESSLVNLAPIAVGAEGTYKYKSEWNVIDQFIVSGNLLPCSTGQQLRQGLYCKPPMEIFAPEHLLQRDNVNMGLKLYRTYQGPRYMGGTSDHLPIVLRFCGH